MVALRSGLAERPRLRLPPRGKACKPQLEERTQRACPLVLNLGAGRMRGLHGAALRWPGRFSTTIDQ